jgi:hypothetical protein
MKYLFLTGFAFAHFYLAAQNEVTIFPVASPKGTISQMVGNTKVEIEYERPLARKRQIFGDLVPWNKVWRTGAGPSTKIRLDKPVLMEGQKVPSGSYSLFTIPNPEKWIVMINSDTSLYGSYGYNPLKDIARFVVTPRLTERHYEALTIDIDLVQSNAKFYLSWTNIQVDFNIITTTAADAMKYIDEQLLTRTNKSSDAYFEAAQYLLFERTHFAEALKLAEHAIQLNKNNGAVRRVKVEIFEYLGLYKDALHEISQALEMERNKAYKKEEDRAIELKYWQTLQQRIKEQQEKI